MAFILGLIGTVVLIALAGMVGLAVFAALASYWVLFVAGWLFLVAVGLIFQGVETGENGVVAGGVLLLLLVINLAVRFYRFGKIDEPRGKRDTGQPRQ